ncbi:hypothetical protein HPB52_017962 [Rhipicephalus sanguineus]|uniref:Uncharacterized protein n=1 Tax=Rhipicephalus sanguineus TaxID=34632 RepID=A0A9D4PH79_RHISA|nr:hypothetical protein HPB52_017962 [Rhipicephalus sanguineus]
MAAPKPTHAYVEYKDGDKAIVAVSLIKRYSPNDVTELANNKLVCWRKSRKGYVADRYIRGDVLTLGFCLVSFMRHGAVTRIAATPLPTGSGTPGQRTGHKMDEEEA